MDFRDSHEQLAFRNSLREWLEANRPPAKRHYDYEDLRAWQAKVCEAGWLGLNWPVEYGGKGKDLIHEIILQEEMARAGTPPLLNVVGLNLVGPVLMEVGTPAQQQRYLPTILSGEEIWCQGFSEPNAGSDLAALSARAVEVDGGYRISGQKVWISFATVASWCFLLARTGTPESRHRGITAFLVDMKSPGLEVRPIRQITGDSQFSELFLDDVFVPADRIVGEVNGGWRIAMTMLALERRMPNRGTDSSIGTVFQRLLASVADRVDTLDEYWRQRLAETYTYVQVVQLKRYRYLGKYLSGDFRTEEGSVEKVFFDLAQQRLRQLMVEVGGLPGLERNDAATDLMQTLAEAVAGGSTEIQKNIIADRLLGLPQ